ncbi:hypothetical protein G210_5240 [Candida maltosa Xu316]|uniref:Uncharacterized protein n=1 Tax=Candida maltosa (strain Xu316) TaxID=1245528 RepID=M3HD72_CANMX|nr:hypothetical protein G210_5240 [Candida maltosa Xu316]
MVVRLMLINNRLAMLGGEKQ